jgi:hypothetical protein
MLFSNSSHRRVEVGWPFELNCPNGKSSARRWCQLRNSSPPKPAKSCRLLKPGQLDGIELFVTGVRSWEAGLQQQLNDGKSKAD